MRSTNKLIIISICVLTFSYALTKSRPTDTIDRPPVKAAEVVTVDSSFSPMKLIAFLQELNVRFADVVYAQAVIETGNFKSKSFTMCNNLFGMKMARSRPTTALGEKFGHAYFKDWRMSVIDYALFQSAYTRKIRTKDGYLEYLSRNYASDSNYINKLKRIYESKTKRG